MYNRHHPEHFENSIYGMTIISAGRALLTKAVNKKIKRKNSTGTPEIRYNKKKGIKYDKR